MPDNTTEQPAGIVSDDVADEVTRYTKTIIGKLAAMHDCITRLAGSTVNAADVLSLHDDLADIRDDLYGGILYAILDDAPWGEFDHLLPSEKDIERRNRFIVGDLYDRLREERLTDRGLLAVTEIAKDLLYACLCHDRVDIEECRSMMGPVSDAIWDECATYDPRPGAFRSFRG